MNNDQWKEWLTQNLIPWYYRWIVICSENLKAISQKIHWFIYIADSVYVKSIKNI
jgi:hypothetical protein